MSSNSFLIKGWAITVLGGLVTLYLTHINSVWSNNVIILAIVMCLLFWLSDAYYLHQEQRFRTLYNKIACLEEKQIDGKIELERASWCAFFKTMFRPIFILSYLPIFVGLIITFLWIF